MYETEQRISRAEALGWTNVRESAVKRGSRRCQLVGNSPDGKHGIVPEFLKNDKIKTEQEQRIAIGKLCGWTFITQGDRPYGLSPNDKTAMRESILPDYLNDLNAMHEAENILTDDEDGPLGNTISRYRFFLNQILDVKTGKDGWRVINASAAQKAEAFLRALNLWKE